MQQPPSTAALDVAPALNSAACGGLSCRAWQGLVGLIVLTLGSLGLAWWLPEMTMLHFLWIAQVVPVLYLWLAWWGTQASAQDEDAS